MFTKKQIKDFLATKGKVVSKITAIQTGDNENSYTTYDPKVIWFGHIQGQVEDRTQVGGVELYMDDSDIIFLSSFKQEEGNPDLQILDCFFAKANVVNATALFVGYKIDLV